MTNANVLIVEDDQAIAENIKKTPHRSRVYRLRYGFNRGTSD